jgi:hypothetical protein
MAILQQVNSKSVIKKFTNQDIPSSIQNPVINRYEATSTASQTVINLNFSIITSGPNSQTDSFLLIIDGKTMRLGAGNDFTFTNINSDLSSSQVTLVTPLAASLNIIAIKLGLKKEVENGMDSRFTQLYEYLGDGFQPFVNSDETVLTPTTTTGTPPAGTFYSTVVNRAALTDLSQNLKAYMGIERIMTQQTIQLQNEIGPNGEPVYSTPNDTFGQVRFVGSGWSSSNVPLGDGAGIGTGTVNDVVEYTFYGTGLNLLHTRAQTSGTSWQVSINGNTETTVTAYTSSVSTVLTARGYAENFVTNIASNLTLGLYTIKIRCNNASTGLILTTGFEILNESSNVKINPGVGYLKGQKIINSAQSVTSYNSGFETGTLGTRGGRVISYLKSDGTIGKAVTPTNASQANLASADHTNEEVARTYYWREFGAGRTDDFSLATGSAGARAFTLDDGVTALVHNAAFVNAAVDGLYVNSTNDFMTLTFVGTGVDIENTRSDGTTLGSFTVFVDGTSIGTLPADTNIRKKTIKLVSGLPYGTHTLKLRSDAGGNTYFFSKFIVYQPKKPSLPSGATEIADYNILANYVASTGNGAGPLSTGVLFKSPSREFLYVGSTWTAVLNSAFLNGIYATTTTNGDYFQYTFFGTGIDIYVGFNATGNTSTVTIDGAAYTGSATITNGGTWTPGTSTITTAGSSGNIFQISGLTLGNHTIKITKSSATDQLIILGCGIQTPIHSHKSNTYADLQNTLTIGSQGISDNRRFSPAKDSISLKKNYAQAVGITSSPTTTSTTAVPVPDLSVTIKTNGGDLDISTYSRLNLSTAIGGSALNLVIYVDGIQVSKNSQHDSLGASINFILYNACRVPVTAGVHKVDVYWQVNSGTATAQQADRNLIVEEV